VQPPIKIQKEGRHINVSFSYNSDLVDIMKENNGWYIYKKMCWMFPASRKSEIIDILKENKYRVTILPEIEPKRKKVKKVSPMKRLDEDPTVVSVWHVCKECGEQSFIGRDELCSKCRAKK